MDNSFLQDNLVLKAKEAGADFVRFVDISMLDKELNRGFSAAILIGIVLSKDYLMEISRNPDYFNQLKINHNKESDEFHVAELATDGIADQLEAFITSNGFKAFSQSEANLLKTGFYNTELKKAVLPHKTIARMSGIGWIGKPDLIITPEYGSAISICTILTDAQVACPSAGIMVSRCGNCNSCINACSVNSLIGNSWEAGITREEMVDVFSCITCFQCVIYCPWTMKYMNSNIIE